jgi:hypothetical protein
MNWPKVTGYVGVTSAVISILSQAASRIIPEDQFATQLQDIIRWATYLWAYACIVMGLYLKKVTHRPLELVWGGLTAGICLLNPSGLIVALLYFFRAYAKLDRIDNQLPF